MENSGHWQPKAAMTGLKFFQTPWLKVMQKKLSVTVDTIMYKYKPVYNKQGTKTPPTLTITWGHGDNKGANFSTSEKNK